MLNFLFFLLIFFFSQFISSDEYISIKEVTNEANLRKGPGDWYPIKWVIKTPSLPLKVLETNDRFNKVELHDGTRGWLSKILTSDITNLIVIYDTVLTSKHGAIKANILKDYIIKKHDCKIEKYPEVCKVEIQNIKGYIKKEFLWGY